MIAADLPLGFKPLMGTDEAIIDDKGRLLFGKKKRERLGDNFVVSLCEVGCLAAYPQAVWDAYVARILSHESINDGRQQYSRLMMSYAEDEIKFDAQGRAVVPAKLRSLGKLKDKVLLIGCGDRVEIWDEKEWSTYNKNPDQYGAERRESLQKAYSKMKEWA